MRREWNSRSVLRLFQLKLSTVPETPTDLWGSMMMKKTLCLSALAGSLFVAASAWAVTATYTGAGTPVAIPDNGNVNTVASAPGPAATTTITDLNLTVNITH